MPVISTQAELRSMLSESEAPAVSIFVPTHRAGKEIRQNPIRLKNLVKQAEDQLVKEGMRPAEARTLLDPLADLVEDEESWRHQAEGLALFRSPNVLRLYRHPLLDCRERGGSHDTDHAIYHAGGRHRPVRRS